MTAPQGSQQPELLTSKEVARHLRLPQSTVYHLAKTGQLPGFQVGRSWRFPRTEIERLIDTPFVGAPTVLVVDDEEMIRQLLHEALTQAGCAVSTAASVDEALAETRQHRFDALLIDLALGSGSGIELIEELEDEYSLRQMAIITGRPDLLEAAPLLERGPLTVIRKPFAPSQVVACIEQLVGRPLSAQRANASGAPNLTPGT